MSNSTASHEFSSRREMMKQSALLAGAMLCPVGLWAEDSQSGPKTDGCLLGFSTYGMKSIPTEKALRILSDIGYDAVEIAVRSDWDTDSAKLTAERKRGLRQLLGDLPLRLTSLMEHVHPVDDKSQAEALLRLKLAAELAHELSPDAPPVVQTVLGGGDFEALKEQIRDRLAAWVQIADDTDTVIAIKPHRGGAVSQPAEAVWLFEQLDKPKRLKMVYDYSHYAFRDLSIEDTIKISLPDTVHVAVKDAVQEGNRVAFKLPGEAGTVDFPAIIRRFHEAGYRGDFNCEVSGMVSGKPGYDPIQAAKTCYANMQAAFEKAGVKRGAAQRSA